MTSTRSGLSPAARQRTRRWSRPVRPGWKPVASSAAPTVAAGSGRSAYGVPSKVAVPDVGRTSPRRQRSVVVLPAPLGPRKPVTRPGWTRKDRSSTAWTSPKVLVSPEISIMGPACTRSLPSVSLRTRSSGSSFERPEEGDHELADRRQVVAPLLDVDGGQAERGEQPTGGGVPLGATPAAGSRGRAARRPRPGTRRARDASCAVTASHSRSTAASQTSSPGARRQREVHGGAGPRAGAASRPRTRRSAGTSRLRGRRAATRRARHPGRRTSPGCRCRGGRRRRRPRRGRARRAAASPPRRRRC